MNKQNADKIIASYVKKLFGFAMSRLSKIDEAEELAAEITFQVYASLLKLDSIANLDGYIYRIARNVYARLCFWVNNYCSAVPFHRYSPK